MTSPRIAFSLSLAALMGTLPIALGLGAGAESRRPLGLAVVGGLLFSQFITLYATPVFYVYLDKVERVLHRLLHRGEPSAFAAPTTRDGAANRLLALKDRNGGPHS